MYIHVYTKCCTFSSRKDVTPVLGFFHLTSISIIIEKWLKNKWYSRADIYLEEFQCIPHVCCIPDHACQIKYDCVELNWTTV